MTLTRITNSKIFNLLVMSIDDFKRGYKLPTGPLGVQATRSWEGDMTDDPEVKRDYEVGY